ncbi:hypothetical protein ScPMuIL_018153 [Solemya velum]
MSHPNQTQQAKVVFLVDVNPQNRSTCRSSSSTESVNNNIIEKRAHAISLSSFRLLNYLSTYFDSDFLVGETRKHAIKNTMKWGFKFFNSNLHISKIESHSFKDFKLRHFEEYENEIEKRLRKQYEETLASYKLSKNSRHAGNQPNKGKTPSHYLGDVLKEVMYDFQWEPEIGTPVRRRKPARRSSEHQDNNGTFCCVFLFASCPRTESELREFAGKKVLDEEILIDSIMSPDVLSKFKDMFKLSLFWIDTLSIDVEPSMISQINLDSLNIVQKTLKKVTGNLIPLDATVNLGKHFLSSKDCFSYSKDNGSYDAESVRSSGSSSEEVTNLMAFQQKRIHSHWSDVPCVFPFTTLLDYYVSQTRSTAEVQLNSFQGIILKDSKEVGRLVILSTERGSIESEWKELLDTSVEIPVDRGRELSVKALSKPSSVRQVFWADPTIFHMYGLLQQSLAGELCQTLNRSYVCTGSGQNKDQDIAIFGRLIQYLMSVGKLMVLRTECHPYLAVLKPLTPKSATLTVLPIGVSLLVEKHLYQQSQPCIPPQPDKETAEHRPSPSVLGLMKKSILKKSIQLGNVQKTRSFDARPLDRWHLPGSKTVFTGLIDKLNERLSQLDFLSEEDTMMLRNLQKLYQENNQPPRARESTSALTPSTSLFENSNPEKGIVEKKSFESDGINEGIDGESTVQGKRGRGSVKSRGEMMVSKSRQAVKENKPDIECTEKVDKKDLARRELPDIKSDFLDEQELVDYLSTLYNKSIDEGSSLITCVQTSIMVTQHFMKNRYPHNHENLCKDLITSKLIQSSKQLREKYQLMEDAVKQEKIREYQLQILLRLEMESALQSLLDQEPVEDCDEEILTMLRTLSFITEPSFLSNFMSGCLVHNYVHSIPKVLGNIYDDLMQPLPHALSAILSPDHSANESVLNDSVMSIDDVDNKPASVSSRLRARGPSSQQPGSVDPISSQPPSNSSDVLLNRSQHSLRSHRLVHHPSLVDVGPKRQIVIEKKIDKKTKDTKKQPCHTDKRNQGTRTKLERRQSVAVMERTKRTPKKIPKKMLFKSPTCRGRNSTNNKLVAETPKHKQFSQVIQKQQERERRRTLASFPDVGCDVVEESPIKQDHDLLARKSPTQSKRALAVVRRMFYSVGPGTRSRNLTKYFKFADRIAGRNRSLPSEEHDKLNQSYVDTPSQFESPNKFDFLKSQLLGTPSPGKRTPKKSPGTPKCIPDSPSLNTRSKSPGRMLSSTRVPFKHRLFSSDNVHGNINTNESVFKTPQKSPVRPKENKTQSLVMDSPCHNTRSRGAFTPTRESVCTALFLKSPGKQLVQNSSTLSSLSESPVRKLKPSRNNFPLKNVSHSGLCAKQANLDDNDTNSSLNFAKSSLGSYVKDSESERHSDVSFSEDLINVAWYDPKGKVSSLAKKNRTLSPSPVKQSSILSPRCLNRYQTKNSFALLDTLSPKKKLSAKRCLSGLSQSLTSPSIGMKQHFNNESVEKTPSPEKKLVKTPDSFDRWHRRKRKYENMNISPNEKTENLQVTESPPSRCNSIGTRGQVIGNNKTIMLNIDCNVNNLDSPSQSRKRTFDSSQEEGDVSSPSKKRRVLKSKDLFQRISSRSVVRSNDGIESSLDLGNASQKSDSIEFSQKSAYSSDYFSPSNDEVFISSQHSDFRDMLASTTTTEQQHDTLSCHIFCSPKSNKLSKQDSPVFKETRQKCVNEKKTVKKCTFSDTGQDQLTDCSSPNKMFSPKAKAEYKTSPIFSPTRSRSHNSVKYSPSTESTVSPSVRKYSPVVTAKSLMHLMNSPLIHSDSISDTKDGDSPSPSIVRDSVRVRKTKGHSRRSLNMQS